MEKIDTFTVEMAVVDWIAIGALLLGFFAGLQRGLGSAFSTLLWLVAAMWLGSALGGQVLDWMTTTPDSGLPQAQFMAYGTIVGAVLALAVVAKILGGPLGRKKGDVEPYNKQMGAMVGLVNAALIFTLATPYLYRFQAVGEGFRSAKAPALAAEVAENLRFLYPDVFRDQLEDMIGGDGEARRGVDLKANGPR